MRIIVGITGASGAAYGLELLRLLADTEHEVHAVVSAAGWQVLEHECKARRARLASLAACLYDNADIGARIASGSFRADAMAIAPCSMRTLAAVACGLADNLICRAADVMLKERRNLVLAVRETPLSAVHLENMLKLARLGVCVMPACPGLYHHPRSLEEMITAFAGRLLDSLGVANHAAPRWQGLSPLADGQ